MWDRFVTDTACASVCIQKYVQCAHLIWLKTLALMKK